VQLTDKNGVSGDGQVIFTKESIAATSPDQVVVNGLLQSHAPFSVHIRGGLCRGTNLLWEINGTDGDLRITAPAGMVQMMKLSVEGGRGGDRAMQPIAIPEELDPIGAEALGAVPANVARMYAAFAQDIRQGARTVPDFDLALQRQRFLATIEETAVKGTRMVVK
jgi:predicted dehydrogenase